MIAIMKLTLIRRVEMNKDAGSPGRATAPSPEGELQIEELVQLCTNNDVEAVLHSSEPRAALAAGALALALDVQAIEQDGIEERDFGDWNAWEWPQIKAELDKLTPSERYTFVPPNGESWQQMEVRLTAALQEIADLPYDSVAVVTHYGPIRALLPIINGEPKESTLNLVVEPGQAFTVEYPKQ